MLFIPCFCGLPFDVLVAGALGGLSGTVRSAVMPAYIAGGNAGFRLQEQDRMIDVHIDMESRVDLPPVSGRLLRNDILTEECTFEQYVLVLYNNTSTF